MTIDLSTIALPDEAIIRRIYWIRRAGSLLSALSMNPAPALSDALC